ncbi:hypothetical protein HF086_004378 [Spodoptera exigua]|uniref:Uncharacterized protein n=1 Tax=Spodoptera exigua TaxID=7107 RepID=A0A922MEB2_SPOEX|nr:hypothetical protein HF086_004378 [Spodoptera exigua]
MRPTQWLNVFLSLENIHGIYRNYSNYNNTKKCLVIIQLVVQNLLYLIVIIDGVYSLLMPAHKNVHKKYFEFGTFGMSSFLTYCVSVVFGTTRSDAFVSYFTSVSRVYDSLKCHREIIYSFKSTYHWLSLALYVACSIYGIIMSVEKLDLTLVWKRKILIPTAVSNFLWRSTVVLEHFMLFLVVMAIVDLSKTLTSLMLEAQQRVDRYGTSDVITVETINGWAELYQELVNCCDKVAMCFGYQTREYESTFKLLLLIIGYMIVVILPVVATQMASDQWAKCQRVMARLHNTMIDGNTMADDGISLQSYFNYTLWLHESTLSHDQRRLVVSPQYI